MTTVSTRTLKNQLSAYLRRAEGGERIVVTRDKKVVAALIPYKEPDSLDAEDTRLRDLEAQGVVVLPQEDVPSPRFEEPRIPSRNRSAAAMVLEDRR